MPLVYNQIVIITFLASFLIWILFAGLVYLWVVDGRVKREVALHAFLSALIAWGAAELLKSLIPIPRPFVTDRFPPLTLTIPTDGSFPSGHTAASFALVVSVWLHNKKLGLFFVIIALTIGIARVLANVHWPIDIIGGIVVGTAVSLIIERLHVFPLVKKH